MYAIGMSRPNLSMLRPVFVVLHSDSIALVHHSSGRVMPNSQSSCGSGLHQYDFSLYKVVCSTNVSKGPIHLKLCSRTTETLSPCIPHGYTRTRPTGWTLHRWEMTRTMSHRIGLQKSWTGFSRMKCSR